jgi:hypothetical protein
LEQVVQELLLLLQLGLLVVGTSTKEKYVVYISSNNRLYVTEKIRPIIRQFEKKMSW